MGGVRAAVLHGLRSVTRFNGRDSRRQFWVYTGCIVAAALIPSQVATTVMVMPQVSGGSQSFSDLPLAETVVVLAGAVALLVILLGAAVCRRLHDTGRRGFLALLPLPFLFCGLYVMYRIDDQLEATGRFEFGTWAGLAVNNVA